MKIAIHMYAWERQLFYPAMLELKSLHNMLNSMEDTTVHTDSDARPRERLCQSVTIWNSFDRVESD